MSIDGASARAVQGLLSSDFGFADFVNDTGAVRVARAYQLSSGGTHTDGPGYGTYEQTSIINVDAGDIIAMKLLNVTTGAHYWGFAHANEMADGRAVGHLWNYGLNTWGWENQHDGGDHDYNDLLMQIDFTSSAGHAWLV